MGQIIAISARGARPTFPNHPSGPDCPAFELSPTGTLPAGQGRAGQGGQRRRSRGPSTRKLPQSQIRVSSVYPAHLNNHGDNHGPREIPSQLWLSSAADAVASGRRRLGATCPTYSGVTAAGPLTG